MAKPIANTEKVIFFLPSDIAEKLKEEAKKKGASVSGLVRMIVFDYFNKQ